MTFPGFALALIQALPVSPAVLAARLLTVLYLAVRPAYRAEIRRNYMLITGCDRPWFWLRNGWRVGRNLALMSRIGMRLGDAFVDNAMIRGENHKELSLEQELHAIMASFHFGAWEYLPQVFARLGHPVVLAVGRQRDRALRRRVDSLRRTGGVRLTGTLRDIFRTGPGITGFMLDNTRQGRQESVVVDGLSIRLPVLPFRLADRNGGGVIPLFARFQGGRLRIDVGKPGNQQDCARALLAEVRRSPEEWVFWAKGGALAV